MVRLKELFEQGYSDREIGEVIGKGEKSVESKRRRMGIVYWHVNKWSEEDKKLLKKLFYEGLGDKEIADKLDRRLKSVTSKRIALGILRVNYAVVIDDRVEEWGLNTKEEVIDFAKMIQESLPTGYEKDDVKIIEYKEMEGVLDAT